MPSSSSDSRRFAAALAAIVVATVVLRWRWLGVPLERDEGEYAYGGWLMLRGVAPYAGVYTMKLPGTHALYALGLAVFGSTVEGVRLTHLAVHSATVALVGVLGRRLLGGAEGLAAAAVFALLAAGRPVQGPFFNAEHAVLAPALAGLAVLARALDGDGRRPAVAAAGLLLGLAPIMKQAGAVFAIAAAVWVVLDARRRGDLAGGARRLGALLAGAAVPTLATVSALAAGGVLSPFRRWAIEIAAGYASRLPLEASWSALSLRGGRLLAASPGCWLLAAAGIVALLADRRRRDRRTPILTLCAASAAGVSAGLYFRPHYFVLALPAAALLAGAGAVGIARLTRQPALRGPLVAGLVAAAVATSAWIQREYLLRMTPTEVVRSTYGRNPFVESEAIAARIRESTPPDATIAVLGSEPQIYFLAGRRAATGHVYMYPAMASGDAGETLQRELLAEIEAARPTYLVWVAVPSSWLRRPDSPTLVFDWFERESRRGWTLDGLLEIERDGGIARWGDAAVGAAPRTSRWIAVLRRVE